eukprot:CAMPEP_0194347506 /NCGR_PEP_ID=MMETSP0171-20130528/106028_1 /TAXON_ID=218684 /ORGANISM="Corethron pennatum, Strain L29A3" /LENGTH=482 /DNA_ID=CAMNT_0039114765 /DNA_START=141 /DNA_END=1589 /DNA_ORIENTATION=+
MSAAQLCIPITDHLPLAHRACDYLSASTDPYHAVHNNELKLEAAGFERLREDECFSGRIRPGGKYFYTREHSTLVAFTVGGAVNSSKPYGFKIIGGHTDTPNLRVKPRSKIGGSAGGCVQLAVECYGGGLWHTWFDRDLGLSGRVLCRDPSTGNVSSRLVRIPRPLARVSTLAIHLTTADERVAFKWNKEDHLKPVLGTSTVLEDSVKDQLEGQEDGWSEHQELAVLEAVAAELDISVADIADFDLSLFDIQPAAIGGIKNEFIHSAGLDNHATCFVSVEALLDHAREKLDDDLDISLVALFDHEEVGSDSATGAGSPIMAEAVTRISSALSGTLSSDMHSCILRKSFILSVDQAHAVHPNYAAKHERGHGPLLNGGVVIKRNANQRYSTNLSSGHVLREVARKGWIGPLQDFVVRNDCGCGSTIGPIIASNTGIRTVDAGMPQLSMHSIRETMGIADLTHGLQLFKAFYQHFREVDNKLVN